jgi:hypothetical protein
MLRLKWGLLAVALWLNAASASAVSFTLDSLPSNPVPSGNGQLEFSNFQFFSPFLSVAPSQVTATILADGIQLSGPIGSTSGLKNFFVLYDVRALGPGIDGASLLLDSHVDADDFGVVLSTKQILGDVGLELPDCSCDGCCGGHKGGDGFDFGLGLDHSLPTDRKTLAFLKTADWDIEDPNNCFRPPFGISDDGAIRLVEGEFDPRTSIRVIDGVSVVASDGTATWTSSINRFTVVPEPGTASLMLLGFTWVALTSYRRSSRHH